MKNSAFSLDKLTTYKEDSRLEVKSAKGGLPASLWESYSAFANSEGGVTVREACINMLTNADFYGRRGVVVQKGAEGFKFANPGSMRVSLSEALQDSASDPRNGVMMKMLAMVEYGERAGSGLQGIFKTWESVFHCKPKLEVSTSGGADRTTLSLNFEGRQPDIEAMKRLYGDFVEMSTQESTQETESVPQNVARSSADVPQNGDEDIQKRILEN